MQQDLWFHKAVNVMLRMASLAAKLLLTLYMGRYLGLSEMGVYGIVFGAVMILCATLGGKLDFVVNRDLVGAEDYTALCMMRDQAVFYLLNYLLFTLAMVGLFFLDVAPPLVLVSIYALSLLESVANMTSTNLISLGHPLLSTFLFFVRAGLWCFVVVFLGVFVPATRTIETIFIAWMVGSFVSVVMTFYAWRGLPWGAVRRTPINWSWIKKGVIQSAGIWLGTLGGMGALYVDRFVVSFYLDLKQVGIITFFASFSMALLSLVQSGFFAFSYPRLIHYHRAGEVKAFWHEVRRTSLEVAVFVFVAAVLVGVGVPLLGGFLGKAEIAAESYTLWLMLLTVWIRGNADSLHYVLYARHQDRPTWLGSVLFLIPSLGGNLALIPLCGLPGVGYSGILAALFLFAWRYYYARKPVA